VAGDENGDRPVTAAELVAVTAAIDDLRVAFDDQREASTAQERTEAAGDVAEARQDLDKLARELGIPRVKLDASIKAAKDAERKEELRPIIAELLAEEEERLRLGEETAAAEAEAAKKPLKEKKAGGASGAVEPVADTEPVVEHWSERSVGELIK
jgi:hypothetical protein